MAKPDQAFQILYDRAPTDADRLRLMRVKDALGLRDDDDIWAIFIALGHFQALYDEVPEKIVKAAVDACEAVRATAEAKTIERLSESVVSQVNAVAGRRAWRELIMAGTAGISVFGILSVAMWYVIASHYDKNLEISKSEYIRSVDESSRWALSDSGKWARRFAAENSFILEGKCPEEQKDKDGRATCRVWKVR
jgi:hypothetical protein